MKKCGCGSYAINHNCHGRDGTDDHLCDVCYWKVRASERLSFIEYYLSSWENEVKWFTNCYDIETKAIDIIKRSQRELMENAAYDKTLQS